MKTNKKISIITLTYNNWKLLYKAINSVKQQKISIGYSLEYLIVDDGTSDFDREYVENLLCLSGINYTIIVNHKNIGTVRSFNKAINKAHGDIIIPLSADDEFYNCDVVQSIIDYFESTGSHIITGLRIPILNNGTELPAIPKKNERKLFDNSNLLLKKLMLRKNFISGASTYYKKEVLANLDYFDEDYILLEDYPFYLKALQNGYNIKLLNEPVIKYGTNGVSSKNSVNPLLKKDLLLLYTRIYKSEKLNFIEKRFVKYTKIMTKERKLHLANIILYLDLFTWSIVQKIIKK